MTTSEGFEGEKNKTIVMYATSEKGDGFVMRIGEYESIEEVVIYPGVFDKDVQITFEYE